MHYDRTHKLTQLPSFAAYGVPLADLITGQCTSFTSQNLQCLFLLARNPSERTHDADANA